MIQRVLKITDGQAEVYLLGDSENGDFLDLDHNIQDKDKELLKKASEWYADFIASKNSYYFPQPSIPYIKRDDFLCWLVITGVQGYKFDTLGVSPAFWIGDDEDESDFERGYGVVF